MGKSHLFRKDAQEQKGRPEVRGELPIIRRSRHLIPVLILGGCVMLLCVWAVVGRINENVYGGGVITCQLQYRSIYSPSSGTLVALDVHEGSTIHMGQLVGRVFSNDDIEEFLNASKLLQYQEEVFEVIKKQVMEIKKQQTAFSDEELKCLDACIKRSEEQLKWYKKYLEEKIPTLAESGAVSQVYVMELHETNNSRMRDYEQYQADKIKQKVSLTKTIYDLDCTLGDYETSVKRVRFEMEQKLHAILYRSRIISYCNGQVTNINVNNGDFIQKGMEQLRVTDNSASDTQVWSVSGYFSVSDARMISAGMAAAVTPSTVHAERDGSIYGIVSSVSTDFETKDSLMRFYRNAAFADFIFSRCNMVPVKVNILLSRNMKSPSGFNWTSGKGPDIRIPSGTMCSVRVVTRQSTPLEIFLGKCNRFMTGNGLIESKKGFRSYSATQEQ